jgi:hypothetical protein
LIGIRLKKITGAGSETLIANSCLNENCLSKFALICPYLRQTQILILEILNVVLRVTFSSFLTLTKNPGFIHALNPDLSRGFTVAYGYLN